jgi:hypothetical protein
VIPDNWLTGAKAEEDRIGAFDPLRSVSPFVSPEPFNDLGCNRPAPRPCSTPPAALNWHVLRMGLIPPSVQL